MISQEKVLRGSGITPDGMGVAVFTDEELELFKEAEGGVVTDWQRLCDSIGVTATAESVPEHYEPYLQNQGRWSLEYATKEQLEGK